MYRVLWGSRCKGSDKDGVWSLLLQLLLVCSLVTSEVYNPKLSRPFTTETKAIDVPCTCAHMCSANVVPFFLYWWSYAPDKPITCVSLIKIPHLQWNLMGKFYVWGICRLDRALYNKYRQWTCTEDQMHGNWLQPCVWLPNRVLPCQCTGPTHHSSIWTSPNGVLHRWQWSGLLVPEQPTLWTCNPGGVTLWPFLWGWVCVWDPVLFQLFVRGTLTMHMSNLGDVGQTIWGWETKHWLDWGKHKSLSRVWQCCGQSRWVQPYDLPMWPNVLVRDF